jgi:hypothetical protein
LVSSYRGNAEVISLCETASAVAWFQNHREIRTGTLAGVLRQGGVDLEEFIKALKE